MKEGIARLIAKYDDLIMELELVHTSYQEYLQKISEEHGHLEVDVIKKMSAAQDNQRRLEFAKAERELLQYHHDND